MMKFLSKKVIVVALLIILILGILLYFLPDIGYMIFFKNPSIALVGVEGKGVQGDFVLMSALLNVTNNAGVSVVLKEANGEVYYKGDKFGTFNYKGSLFIPSNGQVSINVTVLLDSKSPTLKQLIQDILKNNSSDISYKASLLVTSSFFFLSFSKEVEIAGKYILYLKDFVKVIGWEINVKKINLISSNNNPLLNVTVNAKNLSSLDILIKQANITIFYKKEALGHSKLNNQIAIKANESKELSLILNLTNINLLRDAIRDLINSYSISFDYIADLKVYSYYYYLETNYTIKGKQEYKLSEVANDLRLNKIIINQNSILADISYFNNLGVQFFVKDVNANIYFNNSLVGKINATINKEIIPATENRFLISAIPIDLSSLIGFILDNKTVRLSVQADIRVSIFNETYLAHLSLEKSISLDYTLKASINNVRYVAANILEIDANLIATTNLITGNFTLNSASFNAYLNQTFVGDGILQNPTKIYLNKPSQIKIRVYLHKDIIPILIIKLLTNSSFDLVLKNAIFQVNFANNTYPVKPSKDIIVSAQPFTLDINIYNPSFIALSTTTDNRIGIKASVAINIPNVYNLPIIIKSANVTLVEDEFGQIGYLYITNDQLIYPQYNLVGDFIANIDKSKLQLLIQKAINNNGLNVTFKDIVITVSILDKTTTIKLSKTFALKVPTPLVLESNLGIKKVSIGPSPKSFLIDTDFTINLKSMSVSNVYISDARAQIYFKDKQIGYAYITINRVVINLPFTYSGKALINITDEGASMLAIEILKQNPITVSIKNIQVNLKITDIPISIALPSNIVFQSTIKPDINIHVSDFTIRSPGNVIDAFAQLNSTLIKLNVDRIDSLSANIIDENGKILGYILGVSVVNNPNYIFQGMIELQLTQQGLDSLAPKLMNNNTLIIFAKNIVINAYINNVKIYINDPNIYIIKISTDFQYNYTFNIIDLNAYPPGTLFKLNITIDYQIKNGVNTPFNVIKATMKIYNLTDFYLGDAIVDKPVYVSSLSGRINFNASFYLRPEGAPWFASNLVNNGTVRIKISEIYATVKFFDYNVTVPIKGLTYTYKTNPVTIKIEKITIKSVNPFANSAVVEVTILVYNPFKFPVTITYMSGSNYSITFQIFESQREAHPGYYLGYGWYSSQTYVPALSNVTLYPVTVVLTDVLHLFLPPHGTLVPLHTSIYVDALNGRAGIKLYDLYFTFKFEKREIYVTYP